MPTPGPEPANAQDGPVARQPEANELGAKIEAPNVEARFLFTVGPDSPVWSEPWDEVRVLLAGGTSGAGVDVFQGAIIRLRPAAGTTDGRVLQVEEAIREAGAVAVKVDAREHASTSAPTEPAPRAIPMTIAELADDEIARRNFMFPEPVRTIVKFALELGRERAPKAIVPSSTAPLYVTRIVAKNWFRFKSIDVELGPEAYALVARDHDDAGRSNWLGKSAFLAAIPFALTGWHPAPNDDAWIMRGEGATTGAVAVYFSDGSWIERTKRKGDATKVKFYKAGGDGADHELVGASARAEILKFVGLTEADYFASAFVRQKEIDRLVSGRASEMMAIVAAWLELAPLRAAYADVMASLARAGDDEQNAAYLIKELEDRFEHASGQVREALVEWPTIKDRLLAVDAEVMAWDVAEKVAEIAKGDREALEAEAVRQDAEVRARAANAKGWALYQARNRAGEELAAFEASKLGNALDDLRAKLATATAVSHARGADVETARFLVQKAMSARTDAQREEEAKAKVAAGEFDGVCPVAGIQCPATVQINTDREPARRLHEAAKALEANARAAEASERKRFAAASDTWGSFERLRAGIETEIRDLEREHERLKQAEKRAAEACGDLPRSMVEPEAPAQLELDTSTIAKRLADLRVLGDKMTATARELRDADAKLEKTERAQELAAERLVHLRDASLVLGPAGLLKRWAQEALSQIERGANAILAEASAELRVSIKWGYASATALEPACSSCGVGYPAASKAKTCQRCGGVRAPRVEEEVRIELTQRSGAAEDLAGLAVQIAASAWLRESRGSAWRSIAIDEPFGTLDTTHARALGSHLAALLAGKHGFLQSFVVAHDRASLDAFPSRIEITGLPAGLGSSVAVVKS